MIRVAIVGIVMGAALTVPGLVNAQAYVMFPGSSGRVLAPGELSPLSCAQLWVARNEIFHRNGYCFKSRRGINFFGNAGCWTDNARLNGIEQTNVAQIKNWERNRGC